MGERDNGIGDDGWQCTFPGCTGYAIAFSPVKAKSTCYAHSFSPWWHGCTEDHHKHWSRKLPDGSWECPQRKDDPK